VLCAPANPIAATNRQTPDLEILLRVFIPLESTPPWSQLRFFCHSECERLRIFELTSTVQQLTGCVSGQLAEALLVSTGDAFDPLGSR